MKKLSLLKKVGLPVAALATIAPIVTLASCANAQGVVTTYISIEKFREDQSLVNMNSEHLGAEEILTGSKRFCDGNYILFLGSNTFDGSLNFFGNGSGSGKSRNVHDWFYTYFWSSVWYRDVMAFPNMEKLENKFGFVTFIDDFNFEFRDKDNHVYYLTDDAEKGIGGITQIVSPFKKWTTDFIKQTKKLNKDLGYEWDDEAVSESDYIRQDEQAKTYRELVNLGAAMFPTTDERKQTFDTADGNTTSLMVIYKNGKLVEIVNLPQSANTKTPEEQLEDKDSATLLGAMNKHFVDFEEEEK